MAEKIGFFIVFYCLTGVVLWFVLKRFSKRVKYFEELEQFLLLPTTYLTFPGIFLILFWPIIILGILWIRPLINETKTSDEPISPVDKTYIGAEGISVTDLRPVGKIRIQNTIVQAKSRQEFIGSGTSVKVIGQESTFVIVEPTSFA